MRTIQRRTNANRYRKPSLSNGIDHLEVRLALSASVIDAIPTDASPAQTSPALSIVQVTPANSSVLATSPADFTVTFDRPIDPFSLGNDDLELAHVASQGATSPLLPGEAQLTESLDSSDPTGRRLVVTLSKKLVDGPYELILNPRSQIQGVDGSSPAAIGSNPVLADFSVGSAGSGISSAVSLPTPGPVETNSSGVLDLGNDPSQVQYEKFTLAPGHHWLIGLEVEGHLGDSDLDSTLSLFDSGGRLISTSSQGLPDALSDPYLFAGLDAGTYFVGISAQKNVPDASGAYHPSLTSIDSTVQGGEFQLDIVADPADQPTQVLGIQLDHADPISTAPTGLTIQFSGAIDATKLQSAATPALELVDPRGKTWPVSTLAYNASEGQLSLLFDRALPTGTYSIEPTGPTSFTDLAGQLPVAPGLAPGILGSFVVGRSTTESDDLGLIFPSGLASNLEIPPGQATIERFEVINPGLHAIDGISAKTGVSFTVEDLSGHVLGTGPGHSKSDSTEIDLSSGSYQIVFHSSNAQTTEISLVIRQLEGHAASFLDLGVSQGSPLNLRLVTPPAGFGNSPSVPTNPVVPTPSAGTGMTSTVTSSDANRLASPVRSQDAPPATSIGVTTPGGPSVVGYLAFVSPTGQPSASANQVGIVTSSGSSSLAAVASNGGLPAGLIVVPETASGDGNPEPLDEMSRRPMDASHRGGASMAEGVLARSPSSRRADDRTLEDADWAGHVVEEAIAWIRGLTNRKPIEKNEVHEPIEATLTDAPRLTKVEAEWAAEEDRTVSASIGSPLLIGAALGSVAYHYRRRLFVARNTRRIRESSIPSGPMRTQKDRPGVGGPHRLTRRDEIHSTWN